MKKNEQITNYKISLIDSLDKKYREVSISYIYNGKKKRQFIFIRKKDKANDAYYINETKRIIENGELSSYMKKERKRKIKPAIIAASSVVAAGALAVGGYYTYKALNPGIQLDIVYQDSSASTQKVVEYLKTKPYKYNTSEEGFPNYLAISRARIKEQEEIIEPESKADVVGEGYLITSLEDEKAKLMKSKEEGGADRPEVVAALKLYPFEYIVGEATAKYKIKYDFRTYYFEPSTNDYSRVIFYLHGGAYFKNISEKHLASCYDLANKLNAKVYMPLYPIGPLYDANDCFQFINVLYQDIVKKEAGKEIIISGDSAGGGLAISYTQYLYNYNKNRPDDPEHPEIPMPSARILFSPWCDLSMTNKDIPVLESKDIFLSAYGLKEIGKIWAASYDIKDYKISPKYGEFEDKIPSIIFHGSDELLFPDSKETAMKMAKGGARTRFVVGKGLFHIYPLFRTSPLKLPESDVAFDMIYDFIVNKK